MLIRKREHKTDPCGAPKNTKQNKTRRQTIIMQIIKGNYILVRITYLLVKYWLNFTKPEYENQYLTNI